MEIFEKIVIPNQLYNILKWVSVGAVPSLVLFLNTCLPVWEVPLKTTNIIVTTVTAVGILIAGLLGISTVNYNKNKEIE